VFKGLFVFRIEGNKQHLALMARRSKGSIVLFELAAPQMPCWMAEYSWIVVEHLFAVA
jgi:hypothetical protein